MLHQLNAAVLVDRSFLCIVLQQIMAFCPCATRDVEHRQELLPHLGFAVARVHLASADRCLCSSGFDLQFNGALTQACALPPKAIPSSCCLRMRGRKEGYLHGRTLTRDPSGPKQKTARYAGLRLRRERTRCCECSAHPLEVFSLTQGAIFVTGPVVLALGPDPDLKMFRCGSCGHATEQPKGKQASPSTNGVPLLLLRSGVRTGGTL